VNHKARLHGVPFLLPDSGGSLMLARFRAISRKIGSIFDWDSPKMMAA
jgi:hypothetical protein